MSEYINIEKVREHDFIIDDCLTLRSNVQAFREGDIVSITEKLDGAQTHIIYDTQNGILRGFSAKGEVTPNKDLRGFYGFVRGLDSEPFSKYTSYEFYGEWLVPHTIKYNDDSYAKWYLFSVKNIETGTYLPQSFVKGFATKYQLNYVHELYFGPFKGWDHVYSLANMPFYGAEQEGIVIKNQTALEEGRSQHILKYVNNQFIETHLKHVSDFNKSVSVEDEYVDMIVTDARICKILHKLVDEHVIPAGLEPKHIGVLIGIIPERVYIDCTKEEPDIVAKLGDNKRRIIEQKSIAKLRSVLDFAKCESII